MVVTDHKVALTPTTYTADVVSFSDYSPYGVQLDQRHGAAVDGKYKYGTSTSQNRFYPQADGKLKGGTTYRGGMTITQVRPVNKKK
jgi:hypothetical protein